MSGWLNSAGFGPPMWMLSNATSTAWIHRERIKQGEQRGRYRKRRRAPTRERNEGEMQ